jgi:hypothetical protein
MATQTKTSIEALLEMTKDTGYVTLESMALVMLEVAYAEATTPAPAIAHLPKTAEDHRFMVRQRAIERAYA